MIHTACDVTVNNLAQSIGVLVLYWWHDDLVSNAERRPEATSRQEWKTIDDVCNLIWTIMVCGWIFSVPITIRFHANIASWLFIIGAIAMYLCCRDLEFIRENANTRTRRRPAEIREAYNAPTEADNKKGGAEKADNATIDENASQIEAK